MINHSYQLHSVSFHNSLGHKLGYFGNIYDKNLFYTFCHALHASGLPLPHPSLPARRSATTEGRFVLFAWYCCIFGFATICLLAVVSKEWANQCERSYVIELIQTIPKQSAVQNSVTRPGIILTSFIPCSQLISHILSSFCELYIVYFSHRASTNMIEVHKRKTFVVYLG